jgi:pyochelin biosynthetic protein PchC
VSRRWLHRHPVPNPRTRLICFPHAGGSAAAFHDWTRYLPDDVEMVAVQYPGRQDRLSEPPCEDMIRLADDVASALRPLTDLPLVLFGHSMGSGLAHEVTRRLEADPDGEVVHLFVSARAAPHRAGGEYRHTLSDQDLVAAMRALGGPGVEVYDHPQLLPLVLPPLRADLRLLDRYQPPTVVPVRSPITALGGDEDPNCPASALGTWASATSAGSRTVVFQGGHHYLYERVETVLATVGAELTGAAQDRPPTQDRPPAQDQPPTQDRPPTQDQQGARP